MSLDSRALDRRKVLVGAAWAAPVIAVAVAAPAASASHGGPHDAPAGTPFLLTGNLFAGDSNAVAGVSSVAATLLFFDVAGTDTYASGPITYTVAWQVQDTAAQKQVLAALTAANGWSLAQGTLPLTAKSGTATFTHESITDGTTIQLPQLKFTKVVNGNAALGGLKITPTISATNLLLAPGTTTY